MQKLAYSDDFAPQMDTKVRNAESGLRWKQYMPSLLQLISLAIVAVVMLPVLYLGGRLLGIEQADLDYMLRPRTWRIVTNSLQLVVAVAFSAAAIGIPFAWLTTRTDLPFRRVWLVLGLLTMVIPSYIAAVTYMEAFGPVGMLQEFLEPITGVRRLPDIRGFFGAWLAITFFTYPYIVLPVRAALLNSDPALEEAGHSMGLNRWQVFRRITLPQLRPAVLGGMLLVSLYALSDFGAVAIMRYNAFTRAIYLQINAFRLDRAALLAIVLIVFTLVLLAIEWRVNMQQRNYRIGTGTKRQPKLVKLGKWTIPALLFCGSLVSIGVLIPIAVMFTWFVNGNPADAPFALHIPELATNTAGLSAVSALGVAALALPLAILAVRHRSAFNNGLVSLAYIGNILPGIVIALALVSLASDAATPELYQNEHFKLGLLIVGYATRFLPFGISATRSALTQLNPRIEEAGRSLGLNRWQVAWRITIPLTRTGILAGAALVFLSVMKELPTTLILRPIGYETFSTRIWTFYEEAYLPLIGQPGFVLMGISTLGLVLILWRSEKQNRAG